MYILYIRFFPFLLFSFHLIKTGWNRVAVRFTIFSFFATNETGSFAVAEHVEYYPSKTKRRQV